MLKMALDIRHEKAVVVISMAFSRERRRACAASSKHAGRRNRKRALSPYPTSKADERQHQAAPDMKPAYRGASIGADKANVTA